MVSSRLKKALSSLRPETREVTESLGAPVLTIQMHEVVKAIPDECVSERVMEQIAQSVPVERIKDRIADPMVDIPVPPVMKSWQLCRR